MAKVRLHPPSDGQDLPFRQADKHMHMHARIDEALRLPDQREWEVRISVHADNTGCICSRRCPGHNYAQQHEGMKKNNKKRS